MDTALSIRRQPKKGTRIRALGWWTSLWVAVVGILLCASGPLSAQSGGVEDLSLVDLLNLRVSSASKYSQKSTDAPASITIITSEELEGYGFRSLAEALQTLTSFSIGTDYAYTYTGVRGFARPADYNSRILVLLDGHTKNENTLGAGEIGTLRLLDIADIERLEVVRGPGSALYGARAMFAVVNVITKTGRDIEGVRLWSELGTYGHRMTGLQYGRLFGNGIDLALSGGWGESEGEDLFFPEFDAPATNQGIASDLNWGEVLRGRASIQREELRFSAGGYTRLRGIPTAPYQAVFGDPRSEVEDQRWFMDLQYDEEFSTALDLTIRTYADYFETHHSYPHQQDNVMALTLGATWAGAEGRMRWDVRSDHRLVLGAEYQWTPRAEISLKDDLGVADLEGDYPYGIGSIFIQDEYQITPSLAFTGGVRHDRFSTGENSTTPRFALVYHPLESTTIKGLWGMAFRPANIYEKHLTSGYALHLGNPDLDPEQIRSAELAVEHRFSDGLAARFSAFRNDVEQLIDQRGVPWPEELPPSSTGSPFILQFQNGEEVRAQGVEFELNAAFHPGTFGYTRYAYQHVESMGIGAEAPNYPTHSIKVGGTHQFPRMATVGANLFWESGRRTLAGSETDAYSLLNVSVTSPPLWDHLTLSVSAKNLLDTEYTLPSGPQHSLYAIPQPSRKFLFRVGVQW